MQSLAIPIVRGLATLLPPLLTLIVLIWAWRTLDEYVISPVHRATVSTVAGFVADVHDSDFARAENAAGAGDNYVRAKDGQYVPAAVMAYVREYVEPQDIPRSAGDVCRLYVELRWLPRRWFVPATFCGFLGLLYLAGLVGNRSVGTIARKRARRMIDRIPFVRQVYAVVVQVTQHVLAKPPSGSSRVVAVEFPRRNVWCLAYVIKEGLAEVADEADEPILTVFMDTSPIPMSGYTVMVKKSETIPLNITIDEAFRFVISCGIIVPPGQRVASASLPVSNGDGV